MSTKSKFNKLKSELQDLEGQSPFDDVQNSGKSTSSSNSVASYILLFAFLASLLFYVGSSTENVSFEIPIDNIVQDFNRPSQDLLQGMGTWMEEMGYGAMTDEELIELRRNGVTATYTSQIRDLGYTDITLEQLVALQDADVSSTFARMMQELGYNLSIDEMIELRKNDVTAFFTSNMMDLGYSIDELTLENLGRMGALDVDHQLAERLIEERGERPTIDEIIRYKISNQ